MNEDLVTFSNGKPRRIDSHSEKEEPVQRWEYSIVSWNLIRFLDKEQGMVEGDLDSDSSWPQLQTIARMGAEGWEVYYIQKYSFPDAYDQDDDYFEYYLKRPLQD